MFLRFMQPETSHHRLVVALAGAIAIAAPAVAVLGVGIEDETLTLERAIALALEANHELLAAGARTASVAATLDEAQGRRLPSIDLDLGFQRTNNPALVFGNLLGQESFTEESFAIGSLNRPDPLDNWRSRVSLELPLWTGGRIRHAVGAARSALAATSADEAALRQRIVRRVMDAYTAAVVAQWEVESARTSLDTAEAHVALSRDLFESGLVVESDALQAEVRRFEMRELVIDAASHVAVSRAVLNVVIGRDPDAALSLPADLPAPGEVEDETADGRLGELEARARDLRPDLQAARERLRAVERSLALERATRRPELGLAGSFEVNAEDFIGNDGDNWVVGLGLRLPLFDGFTTARIRQAEGRAREAEEALASLRDGIAIEVRRSFYDLRAASQRLEQASTAVALAHRSVAIVEDRYREGFTVLAELLDAQSSLARARLREVVARRDLLLARAGLELAVGNL
jgi:outer membrane protein TolC